MMPAGRSPTARFIADCNVGKLARWLRASGYDATYHHRITDGELVRRAGSEGQILLTRDAGLMRRRPVAGGQVAAILVRGDSALAQLRQVREEIGLGPRSVLSRCLECNLRLRPRPRAAVAARVPPHIAATQTRYHECPRCRRVYWSGTHCERMRRTLAGVLAAGEVSGGQPVHAGRSDGAG